MRRVGSPAPPTDALGEVLMFEMHMVPEMGMRVTPALLNLAQILALPSMDLHQLVRQELGENPALEEIESAIEPCARCGRPLVEGICLACATADPFAERLATAGPEEVDPLLFVSSPQSLSEVLLADLRASLPEEEHPIAVELVGSLDEGGLLPEEPEAIAERLGVAVERVLRVLGVLREVGPLGIAARDTRACMLAQADALAAEGRSCPLARAIILDHLDDLGAGRFRQIARSLRISLAEVEQARAFIRRHLWPYPAQAATMVSAPLQRPRYRTADMSIVRSDDRFVVEVLHSPQRVLRLSPLYRDLAHRAAELDEQERAHVQEYLARARVFLANLKQREQTLQRIGEAIVARQEAFLLHGVRHQLPMTRAEIAVDIGMHESTVSRAIADKTAQLPDRSLLPMSDFFVSARGVHDLLRDMIAHEEEPLSDGALAAELTRCGHPIARRTVAKYRDLLHIPPAHLR
jgi:RNA polymerase sigma-54 factor